MTAFWIVRKSQRPFLQTVWVLYGPLRLGLDLARVLGLGVGLGARAGGREQRGRQRARDAISEVRMVSLLGFYGSTTYQPAMPAS